MLKVRTQTSQPQISQMSQIEIKKPAGSLGGLFYFSSAKSADDSAVFITLKNQTRRDRDHDGSVEHIPAARYRRPAPEAVLIGSSIN